MPLRAARWIFAINLNIRWCSSFRLDVSARIKSVNLT
ncbi:hypothetical protein MPTK1_7g17140 [Marchantia polymorpha subsp. ruderalis]